MSTLARDGAVLVLAAVAACATACSSSSTGGTEVDAASPSPDAGASPDSGLPVNGCGEAQLAANDHTGASDPRTIQAPPGATPQQYMPSCMRVRVGETVTFVGDNAHHPVDTFAFSGPGMPVVASVGTTFTVTMAAPGIVRFNCDVHPTTMNGAIEFVP